MLRALDELAERLGGDGLAGRRLARATVAARARAWAAIVARHGQLPAVRVAGTDLTRPATEPGGSPHPVLVLRLDATLIEAASPKAQAAGTYKGGFGAASAVHDPEPLGFVLGLALVESRHPGDEVLLFVGHRCALTLAVRGCRVSARMAVAFELGRSLPISLGYSEAV